MRGITRRDFAKKAAVAGIGLSARPADARIQGANAKVRLAFVGTANRGGQFAYALSGISSDEVYATSQKLFARLSQEQGHLFSSVFFDLYQRTPQLRINLLEVTAIDEHLARLAARAR